MELSAVFSSSPKSIFECIAGSGSCFYIPAYQRPYTWGKDNINRIFEDISVGLARCAEDENAITFIGTVLTIHDTKYSTMMPANVAEVPDKVMLVVDGQQRMSTFFLLTAKMHGRLRDCFYKINLIYKSAEKDLEKAKKALQKDENEETKKELHSQQEKCNAISWLLDEIGKEVDKVRHFSVDTNSQKEEAYRWYPKIIRAYDDCWGKTGSTARYTSPIGLYLHKYRVQIIEDGDGKPKLFKYVAREGNGGDEIIVKNEALITKYLKKIERGELVGYEGAQLEELFTETFCSSFKLILPEVFPEKFREGELEKFFDKKAKILRASVNLIAFSRYMLNRVCVTYVEVKNESYAFDMFEALNTTGEPLTSIETFKPKVIETEGLTEYAQSKAKVYFELIDKYFEDFKEAESKHKEATRLVMAFALLETGQRLTKHISDQRKYLVDTYQKLAATDGKEEKNAEKRDAYLLELSGVSRFFREEWDSKARCIFNESKSKVNALGLDVLIHAGHDITTALVSRFYLRCLSGTDSEKKQALADMEVVIMAIVAFFYFWRSGNRGTAGIDDAYRKLMKEEFCRALKPEIISDDAVNVAKKLRDSLLIHYEVKDAKAFKIKWLERAKGNPIYKVSTPLARLSLLSALHNSVADKDRPGMLKKGTPDVQEMLTVERWRRFNVVEKNQCWEIEHVAPQNEGKHLEWGIPTQSAELVHSIGNLTILPGITNVVVSDKDWTVKKQYYDWMCIESEDERKSKAKDLGILDDHNILGTSYHGFLKPLTQVEKWDEKYIEERSLNLLERSWSNINEWIFYQ